MTYSPPGTWIASSVRCSPSCCSYGKSFSICKSELAPRRSPLGSRFLASFPFLPPVTKLRIKHIILALNSKSHNHIHDSCQCFHFRSIANLFEACTRNLKSSFNFKILFYCIFNSFENHLNLVICCLSCLMQSRYGCSVSPVNKTIESLFYFSLVWYTVNKG